jgi:hypothetical protein
MKFRRPHILRPLRRALRRKATGTFFAWLPVRLDSGTWIWLETYTRYRQYGLKRTR